MIRDTVGDWQELSALYEGADGLGESELAAWLAVLRREQHRLLPQLEKMLHARRHVASGDFLQSLPKLRAEPRPSDADWAEGSRIGAYRLIRHIGSGGMAEVWLAERADGAFERQVAIKLLFNQPTRAQRETFAERFRRERDILASLHHPHIAGLHDAGVTPGGQPWLALEYVQGEPITDWCDKKQLTIEERVQVFRQVLLAVEHAHANLIIHRDLKPSNILVTEEGEVKLLDFGIAKLIEAGSVSTNDTELTRQGGRPLTLQYASPEQVLGKPLTTSCDVYSLGAVLYELLCGLRPYELKDASAAAVQIAIAEVDPQRPSRRQLADSSAQLRRTSVGKLRTALKGDLDAVALKALAKPLVVRYSTVEALRGDLQRWAAADAVLATVPSAAYRARKFFKRHPVGVTLFGAGSVSLIALSVVAMLFSARSQAEASRATATRDFVIDMFRLADPDHSRGADLSARDILKAGQEKAGSAFSLQPDLQAQVLSSIGLMQIHMAEYRLADETLRKVVQLYEKSGQVRERVLAEIDLADNAFRLGDAARAGRLLSGVGSAAASFPADDDLQAKLALIQGWALVGEGKPRDAKARMEFSLSRAEKAYGQDDIRVIDALRGLAEVESELLNFDAASARIADAARRSERSAKAVDSDKTGIRFERAKIEVLAGRFGTAEGLIEEAASNCDVSLGEQSENCVQLQVLRSNVLLRLGKGGVALQILPRLEREIVADRSPRRRSEALLAACRVLAANRLLSPNHPFRIELMELGGPDAPPAQKEHFLLTLAEASILQEDGAEAETLALAAISHIQARQDKDALLISRGQLLLGIAYQLQEKHDQALTTISAALEGYEGSLGSTHALATLYALNQVASLRATGRSARAASLVNSALPKLIERFGPSSPVIERVRALRATLSSEHGIVRAPSIVFT